MNRPLLLLAVIGIAGQAQSALTFTEVAQWSYFDQNSDAAPVAAVNNAFSARIFSNTVGEVGNAKVTAPDSATYNLNAGPTVSQYFQGGFASMADVTAQYGAGAYDFEILTGPLAGNTDTVNYAGPSTFSENPYISNYSAVTSAAVDAARTFQWSTTYTATGTYTARASYFTLVDLTTSTTLVNTSGFAGSFGSYTLAANTLIAGHTYRYTLTYGTLDQVQSQGGFAPSFLTGSTYLQTRGTFEAVPEPGTVAALAMGGLALARRRRAK